MLLQGGSARSAVAHVVLVAVRQSLCWAKVKGGVLVQGAAIIGAVAVVTMVTAVQNFQKEKQFRQLNSINEDIKVINTNFNRPVTSNGCARVHVSWENSK